MPLAYGSIHPLGRAIHYNHRRPTSDFLPWISCPLGVHELPYATGIRFHSPSRAGHFNNTSTAYTTEKSFVFSSCEDYAHERLEHGMAELRSARAFSHSSAYVLQRSQADDPSLYLAQPMNASLSNDHSQGSGQRRYRGV